MQYFLESTSITYKVAIAIKNKGFKKYFLYFSVLFYFLVFSFGSFLFGSFGFSFSCFLCGFSGIPNSAFFPVMNCYLLGPGLQIGPPPVDLLYILYCFTCQTFPKRFNHSIDTSLIAYLNSCKFFMNKYEHSVKITILRLTHVSL